MVLLAERFAPSIPEVINRIEMPDSLYVSTASSVSANVAVSPSSNNSLPFDTDLHCATGDLVGPLGLLVQGLLAFLAFSCLIVKRFCEPKRRRRPWLVWFFDTSKQAIGAAVIHFANVFLANFIHGDPCTWYFVSFLLDSTVGLFVIYVGLKITQIIIIRKGCEALRFGEYGKPAQCKAWFGQCMLYIFVMIIEKILMTLLVLFDFWDTVRKFLMSWIKDPHMELIIVMFIVPLVVNAIIFWVVDNFLKKSIQTPLSVDKDIDNTSVKFFKTSDRLQYNRIDRADDSDCLLSNEEDNEVIPNGDVGSTRRLIQA